MSKLIKVINFQQFCTYRIPNLGNSESNQFLLESSILQISSHATRIKPGSFLKLSSEGWAHAPDW